MFRTAFYLLAGAALLASCADQRPSATTIPPGGKVTVKGTFADPDQGDGPWTYNFRWGNGQTSGTATAPVSITRSRTYSTAGTYNIRLRVTDARGAFGISNTITVRVQ